MVKKQNLQKGNSLLLKINYKVIQHERIGDAPFIGALISSCDCLFNCVDCFNQEIKDYPTLTKEANEIIEEIQSNPFNKGIIFAGLEWALQKEELEVLVQIAKQHNLLTMVYTGYDVNSSYVQWLVNELQVDYVKYGQYDESKKIPHNECGVTLASINQHIIDVRGENY